ncbi:MAG: type 4 prepilin-like proteins leader peptide-processing enzyme [Candidatus Parcubacteria bacterium]|nr:MAG: type 4 prepilin-like proteins leader peptide-processing enzyme [Candidatus Parcubacteria bacterium]
MIYFIFGLFLGSLVNNIAYRLVRNEDFILGSSKCDSCQKNLLWYELIPIISYLIQGGKCRNCRNKISFRYPLTELITGLLTYKIAEKTLLISNFNLINFLYFNYFLIITLLFFILSLYDLETFYIEDKLIYLAIFIWLIFALVFNYLSIFPKIDFNPGLNSLIYLPELNVKDYIFNRLYYAFIFALSILIIFILTLGKGIGLGDIKLFFILGLYFNFSDILAASAFTILISGIFSLFILIYKRKIKQAVPLGPFIFAGLFLSIFTGDYLYELVNNLLILDT